MTKVKTQFRLMTELAVVLVDVQLELEHLSAVLNRGLTGSLAQHQILTDRGPRTRARTYAVNRIPIISAFIL